MDNVETPKRTGKEANLAPPFQKGQSGNPNGRPKGRRSYTTIAAEAIRKIAESQNMTPEEFEELFLQTGIKNALKGNYKYYQDHLDRTHGKPKSEDGSLGSENNPIHVKHAVYWGRRGGNST